MARAIEGTRGGTVGHVGFGVGRDATPDTPARAIHDGDTMTVRALGDLGVRFLGVDAPESSFELPGRRGFVKIADRAWERYLTDPFDEELPPFDPPLEEDLREYLEEKVGRGCAANHARLAKKALDGLRAEVERDMEEQGLGPAEFRLHLSFAREVMDGYGRLLAFVNREQKEKPRPKSYNERLLAAGLVLPYMIWPNVNPFRRQGSLFEAVPRPGGAKRLGERQPLRSAREWVRAAREERRGVFDRRSPLRLEAFELRYLARRAAPDRWVLDLGSESDELVRPQEYHRLPTEDRLYVPAEYVPLFMSSGWEAPGFAPEHRRARRATAVAA